MQNTGQQVLSAFTASPAAAALGVAGMVPLLAYGLALDTRKDWDWVKKIDDATSEVALQLFGSERQVNELPPSIHQRVCRLQVVSVRRESSVAPSRELAVFFVCSIIVEQNNPPGSTERGLNAPCFLA